MATSGNGPDSRTRRQVSRVERLLASAERRLGAGGVAGAPARPRRVREPALPAEELTAPSPAGGAVVDAASGRLRPERREVVVIGSSTGGPPVLQLLLSRLPADFKVPVVIVQHMLAEHLSNFAELLTRQCGRKVAIPTPGQTLEPGNIWLAGPDGHLVLKRAGERLVAALDKGPPENEVKPAVDPLFRSAAALCGPRTVGVVCTGMGCDGAQGAHALRGMGAPILVQDRATSVVWGMPGAVVGRGGADLQAPPHELVEWVVRLCAGEGRTR